MRRTKGLPLRFIMAALLVWMLCQSPALAAEEGTAVTIGTGIPETPRAEVTVSWDDVWFTRDASVYRQDLALSSMALSGAAYNEKDVRNALKALGFERIESCNYQLFNEAGDQAAYTFGLKSIKDRAGKTVRLAAVVVRGTGDYTEWASNLDVGTRADHEGFSRAAEELQKNLEKYLNKAGITEKAREQMKFLLTGHSRGAAVANLLAARLPELAKKENIYAYTFATPAVSTDAVREGYENIFNIINGNDLVTQVPLADWGYHRYGVDLALPTDSGKLFEQMNEQFKALTGQDYVGYHDPEAVEKMTGALSRLIPTTAGVNMEMFATLLSGDFQGLSELVKQNGFAALLMGKTAMEVSSQLTPMLQNEQGALRSGHCMAGYYSWLSVSGDLLTAEAGE